MNTQDTGSVAEPKSDEELLLILAAPAGLEPEVIEEAKVQLHSRGVLVGVAGWLKFLCIFLTILVPVGMVLGIVGFCIGFIQDYGHAPYLGDGELGLLLLPNLFVAIFAMVAGTKLWRKRSNAVTVVKKYFVAAIFAAFVRAFISYFAWGDSNYRPTDDSILFFAVLSVGLSFFGAFVWSKYLNQSARVRNTYDPRSVRFSA